jgi:tRNA1(Val) A37 N6-methylase TrmN6
MERDEIHVLNKRVRLLQPADGFRTSLDSVMLAAACPAAPGESVLDLGCGVGGAGFCVAARVANIKLTGIEIQQSHTDLAVENIALNNMNGRCEFICSDVRDYAGGNFDHAICNPPYNEAGHHTPSPSRPRATALNFDEKDISISDWIDAGFRNLKNGGSFTMIHRADKADKIIQALGKKFGAIETIPLWPREGQEAKRVIIRALKNRKSPAKIHHGIVLHETNGDYTAATEDILRGMKAIA